MGRSTGDAAPDEGPSSLSKAIQEHLDLKQRNAGLDRTMPLDRYSIEDPFENHPLFKTEEQARVEETMDGAQSIADEPTSVDWGSSEDTFIDAPVAPAADAAADEPDEISDETLWSRSRDFDWGD